MDALTGHSIGAHCHVTPFRHDHSCTNATEWTPRLEWPSLVNLLARKAVAV